MVATEKEQYEHLKPGGLLHVPIEVLPEFRPVFVQVDCGVVK